MNFGPVIDEAASHEVLDAALIAGINYLDTANVYGWDDKGRTESILGSWFGRGGEWRDKVVLATKVYGSMGATDWPNHYGLAARSIVRACEESLRRLSTDWIDVYQMHHVDRDRKSTRLNSSHANISYAVFCLKKKQITPI